MVTKVDLVVDDDAESASEDTADDGQKGEVFEGRGPATVLAEYDGVGLVEEEENAVDEGLVEGEEGEDGLRGEEP